MRFGVPVPDDVVPDESAGAGRKQAVQQLATCELHVIMQFVVVEVSGVARPVRVTVGIEVCASPPPVPAQMTAAARRIANTK